MFINKYNNFVRPASPNSVNDNTHYSERVLLTGEEARKLYLEETKEAKAPTLCKLSQSRTQHTSSPKQRKSEETHVSDKDLFLKVQNNEVDALRQVLNSCPERIKTTDEFGWSLLMIACQANSIDVVKELLRRGADTDTRDKAGNSAKSLIIKNKNYTLANIFVNHKEQVCLKAKAKSKETKLNFKEEYYCELCNKTFLGKDEHLSSTVHNICASRGKKIPTNYVIPSSNKGYQIMLKVGWDKESGLGPDGTGNKYPIKTEQKKDRKGLGHEKRKKEETRGESVKIKNRKLIAKEHYNSRKMEIDFRREFY